MEPPPKTSTSAGRPASDQRSAVRITRRQWRSLSGEPLAADPQSATDSQTATDPAWLGAVFGRQLQTGVTILFYTTDTVGEGPRLHVHDYDEVFVIRSGTALFTIGEQQIEAHEGDVLMGPAHVPHKFHNPGPGRLETIDIHLAEEWTQTDLPDPTA